MNLPEFGLPERLKVPPFGEQQTRLRRQILLGVKVAAVILCIWLVVFGITSCVNAINDMVSLPAAGSEAPSLSAEATAPQSPPGHGLA